MFELDDYGLDTLAYKQVIGIGDDGCISLNRFINMGIKGVKFIAINTDAKGLSRSLAPTRLQLGEKIDSGFAYVQSAKESHDDILAAIDNSDMTFIIADLGDNTGSEITPMITSLVKDTKALTVAIVKFTGTDEDPFRKRKVKERLSKLKGCADAVIAINSDRILSVKKDNEDTSNLSFEIDKLIAEVIQSIESLLIEPELINLDFADVQLILRNASTAAVGIGTGTGENASMEAVTEAAALTMFDESIKDAKSIIINITGSDNKLSMFEINEAIETIHKMTTDNVNIIWGAAIDNSLGDTVKATIIASGFESTEKMNLVLSK